MTTSSIHFHQIDGKFLENILKKKKKKHLEFCFGFKSLYLNVAKQRVSQGL